MPKAKEKRNNDFPDLSINQREIVDENVVLARCLK
jgi:hypothetical protein